MIHHTIDSQATLAHPTVGATIVADRADPTNPNRHIWNNNGTWWLHYTEHLADFTKRRVRRSLRTHDLELAIRRRDEALNSAVA